MAVDGDDVWKSTENSPEMTNLKPLYAVMTRNYFRPALNINKV